MTVQTCGRFQTDASRFTRLRGCFEHLPSHFIKTLTYFCSIEIPSPAYLLKISWSLEVLSLHEAFVTRCLAGLERQYGVKKDFPAVSLGALTSPLLPTPALLEHGDIGTSVPGLLQELNEVMHAPGSSAETHWDLQECWCRHRPSLRSTWKAHVLGQQWGVRAASTKN